MFQVLDSPTPLSSFASYNHTDVAQGLVKFDPLLVNAKESSVAPTVSADVEPTASEDLQHFESTLAALPHTGHKAHQHQPQQPPRSKVPESDRRPKKRITKAEDNAHNKSWDSDQSLQVAKACMALYMT